MIIKTPAFTIRPIREDADLPAILEVYRQCEDFLALGPVAKASQAMVQADLKLSKDMNGVFCGIFDRQTGEMLGIVDFVSQGYQGRSGLAYLSLLMIASPWRSHGLGALVVSAVEAEIRKSGQVQSIEAGVQVNNPGAIRFWQRMGYRIVSEAKLHADGTTAFDLRKDWGGQSPQELPMLSSDVLSSLLSNWDLAPIVSTEVFKTSDYRNSGNVIFIETLNEKYVLKRITVQQKRQSEYMLLAALHAHGVPVAVPKLTREGEPFARQGDAYFCLSPYLPGAVISDHFAPGAEERARRFGIALAQLHVGLKQYEHLVIVPEMDLLRDVTAACQVVCAYGGGNVVESTQMVLSELKAGLTALNQELPIQLIHRDAHAANMLFLDEHLSGWLDFELIVRGPRLFDLCYCATSLLMNGIDDSAKRLQWLELLAALVDGYTSMNPLTLVERSALWYGLLSIEVIFAAYFIHTRDEKGITQNLEALLWIYENRNPIQTQSINRRAASLL